MNDPEKILEFLRWTGHLRYPFGEEQDVPTGPFQHAIHAAETVRAIASFQSFEPEMMDRLAMKFHGRPARFDGEMGPATQAAMDAPRCGHPDYGPDVQAAIGSGSWAHCHNIGDFHAATVYVRENQIPSFLSPVFPQVWDRVSSAYADIGLKWLRADSDDANTVVSFVSSSNGWIGLAVVGQQESCSSQIWAKFLATYRPSNVLNEWTTLVMHELGHNAGLQHSRGGVMNPSIVQGLAPTWRGDPSESVLVHYYGGDPIEPPPVPGVEMWTHLGYKSNRGQTQWVELPVPLPLEKEQ